MLIFLLFDCPANLLSDFTEIRRISEVVAFSETQRSLKYSFDERESEWCSLQVLAVLCSLDLQSMNLIRGVAATIKMTHVFRVM